MSANPPVPPADLTDTIREAAAGPKSVTVDGQNVQAHDLKDLIAADNHLQAKKTARRPTAALHFTKMVASGAE